MTQQKKYNLFFFRMTCGLNTVQVFDTNFLRFLYASRPSQWISRMNQAETNVFDREILMFPFDAKGHKSLFVVIGASHIRDYTSPRFNGCRPCILHIDPNNSPSNRHDHHAVADKLRTWLNRLWRWQHDDSDHFLIPFNKRSMPISKNPGKADFSFMKGVLPHFKFDSSVSYSSLLRE